MQSRSSVARLFQLPGETNCRQRGPFVRLFDKRMVCKMIPSSLRKPLVWIPLLVIVLAAAGVASYLIFVRGGGGSPAGITAANTNTRTVAQPAATGIHKIKHVVIIMQENRSFDSYFGTFPGADGIPMKDGQPAACVSDPANGGCVRPYHDTGDMNTGGPHGQVNATADIDDGRMDGFVGQAEKAERNCAAFDPACAAGVKTDVMGYHTDAEIPDYWKYAKDFVLQDRMFEPNASWSLPAHLFMVSAWSAKCSRAGDPQSCVNALQRPGNPPDFSKVRNNIIKACSQGSARVCQNALDAIGISPDTAKQLKSLIARNCNLNQNASQFMNQCEAKLKSANIPEPLKNKLVNAANKVAPPDYAWTDLTYLLHAQNVSWAYYVYNGTEPDCEDDSAMTCTKVPQNSKTPGIWNPLPYFDTVKQDGQMGNIKSLTEFFKAAKSGALPAVSWIDPAGAVSEHPPALVSKGQAYVTGLINAIMEGPDWDSTAIFLSWDDWGGFYDHAVPPSIDQNGYGLRVPGIVISPYAKKGYIDHQTLSHDAYLKFIEDDFLGGQRLNPATDGRPDPRPDVREDNPALGNLINDFDFSQTPRRPVILKLHP